MHESKAVEQEALVAAVNRSIAADQEGASNAKSHAEDAKEQIRRLKEGTDIAGGLGKSINISEIRAAEDWPRSDFTNLDRLVELFNLDAEQELFDEIHKNTRHLENAPRAPSSGDASEGRKSRSAAYKVSMLFSAPRRSDAASAVLVERAERSQRAPRLRTVGVPRRLE